MLLTLKFLYKNSYMRLHRLLYNQKRRKNHIFLHKLLYNYRHTFYYKYTYSYQHSRSNMIFHIYFYNYLHNRSNMISHTNCYNHSLHYQYIFRHKPLHIIDSMYLDNFDSMYFDNRNDIQSQYLQWHLLMAKLLTPLQALFSPSS